MSEYTFKKMDINDIKFFNYVRNSAREWLHNSKEFSLEQSIEWFKKENPLFYILSFNNSPIGYFRTSDFDIEDKTIHIGLDLECTSRGIGHAKSSYPIFMNFLNKEIGIKTFYLRVLRKNIIAFNLYKKLGFIICEETENDLKMELKNE